MGFQMTPTCAVCGRPIPTGREHARRMAFVLERQIPHCPQCHFLNASPETSSEISATPERSPGKSTLPSPSDEDPST